MSIVRSVTIAVKVQAGKAASELKKLADQAKSLGGTSDKASRSSKKLTKGLKNSGTQARKTRGKFLDANKSAAKLGKGMDSAKGAAGRLGGGLSSAGKGATRLAGGLATLAAAGIKKAGEAIGGAVVKSVEFEGTMADIAKVVPGLRDETGKATKEFDEMKSSILALSSEIAIVPDQFGKIITAAGQGGIAKNELVIFAEDAAKMAVAFDTTAEKAGGDMAKIRAGLGLTQDEMRNLGGTMNHLSQAVAVTGADLVNVTKSVGGFAKTAGLSGEQTSALAATIMATGKNTSVTATGIQNFTKALVAGESATKKQREAYELLGFDAEEVARTMVKGGADAEKQMIDVLRAIKALERDKQGAQAIKLFGATSIKAVAPLIENIDELGRAFDLANDKTAAATSMQKEFEVRSNTTANAWQLLKNRFIEIPAIKIGDALLPVIKELTDFALSPEVTELFDGLLDGAIDTIRRIVDAIKWLGRQFGSEGVDVGNTIDGMLKSLRGLWNTLREGFHAVGEAMEPMFKALGRLASSLSDTLGLAGDEAEDFGEEIGSSVIDMLISMVETATQVISDAAEIVAELKPVIKPIVDFLRIEMVAALDMVTDHLDGLRSNWAKVREGFAAFKGDDFVGGLKKMGEGIFDYLTMPLRTMTRQLIRLADAIPGGSRMVPQALREFAGAGTTKDVLKMVRKMQQAGAGAALEEAGRAAELAEAAALAEADAAIIAASHDEADPMGPELPPDKKDKKDKKGKGKKGKGKGKKERVREEVTDPMILAALLNSPDAILASEKERAALKSDLGKMNELDQRVVQAKLGASGKKIDLTGGGGGAVGPQVSNTYNTMTFMIDARGATDPGQVRDAAERGVRASVAPFQRHLSGLDAAAIEGRVSGGRRASR